MIRIPLKGTLFAPEGTRCPPMVNSKRITSEGEHQSLPGEYRAAPLNLPAHEGGRAMRSTNSSPPRSAPIGEMAIGDEIARFPWSIIDNMLPFQYIRFTLFSALLNIV